MPHSSPAVVEPGLEPERYELQAPPAYRFDLDRRDFFTLLGGGIVVLLSLPAAAQESGAGGRRGGNALPQDVSAWMHIGEDSRVTFFTGKVEIGQNIRTSLTQAVAEELFMPPAMVSLVMADTELTPYDMGTFGSRTTPTMAPQLRRVAATAREWLKELAAAEWNVDPQSVVRIADGQITSGEHSASFGELAKGKNLIKTVGHDAIAQPAGESLPKIAAREIVTGGHRYTSDMKRPGMLYGRMLRPPGFGSKLTTADAKPAAQIPGVQVVREGEFLGVVSPDASVLSRAIAAIQPEWSSVHGLANQELSAYLKANVEGAPASPKSATVTAALQQAAFTHEASYNIAYIAHVPLEPRAAVAEWTGDKLTVWTGTQRPFGVREELAKAFQISEARVRVIVPDTGSAYGGKHTGECAIEAARLAKGCGKPVKLVWTREEEFTWAYFRPAGVIDIRSSVDQAGKLTAWEFTNYNSGGSGLETPYDVAVKAVKFHSTASPLRQGSYRGLAATANHFARESHMDELARAANIDPLEFRCRNLKDERMVAVLRAAAAKFGWGKAAPDRPRQGFGLSCGFDKGGYVASCVEVSMGARAKIERVVTAFECGAIVNPEHLKNQVEGALVMGIGGALFEEIQFADGKILNPRLSKYRVPRFNDLPVMETVLIDRKDLPSAGAGETPIVALAPALGNAIRDATGKRCRDMPMRA